MIAASILIAAPVALCLAGACHARPPVLDDRLRRLPEAAALFACLLALAAGALLVAVGPVTAPVPGADVLGLSVRLDSVSVVMSVLVGFLGWVLVRYSATHLRDTGLEARFTGWLCATLGGLLFVATAGHLAQLVLGWLLVGYGVNRLFDLFSARPGSLRALRKHRIVAQISALALIAATGCLFAAYGTLEIGAILDAARGGAFPVTALAGAVFVVIAAAVQGALMPANVWLQDAGDAPVPVSALVQALVVGSGLFLAIRLADVLLGAPLALAALGAFGGASALAAGLVARAQFNDRSAQAWSTASHAGFAMLLCGLGLFALALLHLVGHAIHRTHALLASGEQRQASGLTAPSTSSVVFAMTIALGLYAGPAIGLWLLGTSVQVIAVGAMLTIGVACLGAQSMGEDTPRALARAAARTAATFAVGFLTFQWVAQALTADTLPAVPAPTSLDWVLMALAMVSLAIAALLQARLQDRPDHPVLSGLRVHVANGFYLDALMNRSLRNWHAAPNTKEI